MAAAEPETRLNSPPLHATALSQFVRLDGCERRLWFERFPRQREELRRRWRLTEQPLAPLLSESGERFERDAFAALAAAGWRVESLERADVAATRARLERLDERPLLLVQAALAGEIVGRACGGRADAIVARRGQDGRVRVLVADLKASRSERVEHRLQVAFYARLVEQMLAALGQPLAALEGAVLRPDTPPPRPGEPWPTFDLAPYLLALEHLVAGPDSALERVESTPFDELDYHLDYKCDGCLFNALCFYDSAERLDLALVPYIQPAEKRALRRHGVRTLRELAELKTLPTPRIYGQPLPTAPGREELVARLAATWPVGPGLDRLVQRARRVLHRFDRSVDASGWLLDGGFGSLPDDSRYPYLVKVFVDAQHDYLQDRLYLVGALVRGPRGEQALARITEGPPDDQRERALLADWLAALLPAIAAASASASAPLHLYLYDRYDQKVLLDALRRHLDVVAGFPALYDLLTARAALQQPMVSFLADEVRERLNLDFTCQPLHDVARAVVAGGKRFDWTDGELRFYDLFRARLFDNRRPVRRHPDGRLEVPAGKVTHDDPLRVPIESASRFSSQIPLEYAYGAWGRLPSGPEEPLLRPFRAVTLEHLRRFQEHRLRALAHIESAFTTRNRELEKRPLPLADLARPRQEDFSLKRALEEFLFLEHHARVQEGLALLALPLGQRAAAGRSLPLECLGPAGPRRYRFRLAFSRVGLDPRLGLQQMRLREGDLLVLNEAEGAHARQPWWLARGQLARLVALDEQEAVLELRDLAGSRGYFRYPHRGGLVPEVGRLYSADEMLDDFNADKQLLACRQAESNALYRALVDGPGAPLPLVPDAAGRAHDFLRLVERLEGARRPTPAQAEVIAARLADPLLLVQGPPGTGKSHTLGWAVLARLFALDPPPRVAVSSKTHNAVAIVLASIAEKRERLLRAGGPLAQALGDLVVAKVDGDDPPPPGVLAVSTYAVDRAARSAELADLLGQRLVVVGGTPAGLHNLARALSFGRGQRAALFDLVVLDEASQMSLPEALLACAALDRAGRLIVVGDHRQMPPILVHDWENERRRLLEHLQPQRSVFESLLDRGFPRVALDQSFRLHRVQAEFLRQHVYAHDGIPFHSTREHLLPAASFRDPFVAAALDPSYPIVVVEHGERDSQQMNALEVELAARLIEACLDTLGLDPSDGLGVVVPHRAQKAALARRFPALAAVNAIDTVERFQGGERDVVLISATASDPSYVLGEADFLLNPNRFTVAISRPRKKLVVLVASTVLRVVPSDLEQFEHAALWKQLRFACAGALLWSGHVAGVRVAVYGCHTEATRLSGEWEG